MKLSNLTKNNQRIGGYTLVDIMVASGMLAMVGLCVYYGLQTGLIMSAKNTAENLAHDSARIAVNRLVHDIHNAVSIPELGYIDTRTPGSFTAPAGSWVPYGTSVTFCPQTGSAARAGVSFQKMGGPNGVGGGPYAVVNDPGNDQLIQIGPTQPGPQAGMRLIFPYYNMEDDISKVTSNGNHHYNVWTANALETRFKKKKNTYHICFYTTRYAYVVENNKLNFYASAPRPSGTWPATIAFNVVSATPFTQTDTQYVGVNLTTQDGRYSNRNFKAVNTLLAGSVPYRAQLCTEQ